MKSLQHKILMVLLACLKLSWYQLLTMFLTHMRACWTRKELRWTPVWHQFGSHALKLRTAQVVTHKVTLEFNVVKEQLRLDLHRLWQIKLTLSTPFASLEPIATNQLPMSLVKPGNVALLSSVLPLLQPWFCSLKCDSVSTTKICLNL